MKVFAVRCWLAVLLMVPSIMWAADPPAPTATENAIGIATTATTVFASVSVLVVAMVAFFIIVRIVKGIRK